MLHTCRRFEFCRDVIILVSKTTPKEYLEYLTKREYAYHILGEKHVDLEKTLALLSSEYKVRRVLTDTGRILGNLLIEQGCVSELSLLVHPVIVGKKSYNIFGNINKNISLKLLKKEFFRRGYIWLAYRINYKMPKSQHES